MVNVFLYKLNICTYLITIHIILNYLFSMKTSSTMPRPPASTSPSPHFGPCRTSPSANSQNMQCPHDSSTPSSTSPSPPHWTSTCLAISSLPFSPPFFPNVILLVRISQLDHLIHPMNLFLIRLLFYSGTLPPSLIVHLQIRDLSPTVYSSTFTIYPKMSTKQNRFWPSHIWCPILFDLINFLQLNPAMSQLSSRMSITLFQNFFPFGFSSGFHRFWNLLSYFHQLSCLLQKFHLNLFHLFHFFHFFLPLAEESTSSAFPSIQYAFSQWDCRYHLWLPVQCITFFSIPVFPFLSGHTFAHQTWVGCRYCFCFIYRFSSVIFLHFFLLSYYFWQNPTNYKSCYLCAQCSPHEHWTISSLTRPILLFRFDGSTFRNSKLCFLLILKIFIKL